MPSSLDMQSVTKIQRAIVDTLRILNIQPADIACPFHGESGLELYTAKCMDEARRRGYISRDSTGFSKQYVCAGAAMGYYAYMPSLHGENNTAIVLASLIMGLLVAVDDGKFRPVSIAQYGSRLIGGRPQCEKGLDHFAEMVSDVSDMYDPAAGDIIRLSLQAYMTANHMEHKMSTKRCIHRNAARFPMMLKIMTSVASFVFIMSFPPRIPSASYLQFLPDATLAHNHTADIMSYYKEALEGEYNYVTQLAEQHGVPAVDMLGRLVEEMRESHERVMRALSASVDNGRQVAKWYRSALVGFVVFQLVDSRYRLHEIDIRDALAQHSASGR